jgi:hypothetical protein
MKFGFDRRLVTPRADGGRNESELLSSFHVQRPVTHDRAGGKIDVPLPTRSLEQFRPGFPAFAAPLRGMGTIVERVDVRSVRFEKFIQAAVNAFYILDRVESPVDPGLIRNADDQVLVVVRACEGFADPPVQLESIGVLEVVKVRVQRAVTIDKEGPTERSNSALDPYDRRHGLPVPPSTIRLDVACHVALRD